jgi:phosphatidylglycerol:prolipoprotein diacylglycerol transferase
LYEALLEGALLYLLLAILVRREPLRLRRGTLFGLFLVGYACARAIAELFREPDAHIGFLAAGLTMGQLLSVPVFLFGLFLLVRAKPSA